MIDFINGILTELGISPDSPLTVVHILIVFFIVLGLDFTYNLISRVVEFGHHIK